MALKTYRFYFPGILFITVATTTENILALSQENWEELLVRKVVIAENDLLLSLVAQAPEVACIASNHLPVAALGGRCYRGLKNLNTNLGVPYYSYSKISPKTLF